MKLSHYRRAILRPLTLNALVIVQSGDLPELTLLELYRIPDELFQTHFHLFNDLDRICGIATEDHHVEEVEPDRLPLVIRTLRAYPCANDRDLEDMIDRLWGLCHRGLDSDRPVFFVL